MKSWEENWRLEHHDESGQYWYLSTPGSPIRVYGYEDEPEVKARARLASAAPEMARVLLAVEWMPHPETELRFCPSCDGEYPEDFPNCLDAGHRPGCALDAALRKAGAR